MSKDAWLWITWEHQVRNISMSRLMGCDYVELESKSSRMVRYFMLGWKTIRLLGSGKYEVIFFQNPSIMLGLICALYKKLNPACLFVGDFHNAALEPGQLRFINAFIARTIDITLVSNRNLFAHVETMGGVPFAFPDPIPLPEQKNILPPGQASYILFISSWADDEPINNVLDAFIMSGLWENSIELRITGRVKLAKLNKPREYYERYNIKFLGFVSESDYWQELANASLNIDLTTRDDCLVCGAYEAISVSAPILLSNNAASLDYFGKYARFTDNSVADIKNNMIFVIDNLLSIRESNAQHRADYLDADSSRCLALKTRIASL